MQRTIAKGITFMVSQSGLPGYYNLYFSKYVDRAGVKQVRLSYHEKEERILQYADEEHPVIEFSDVDSVLRYIEAELSIETEQGIGTPPIPPSIRTIKEGVIPEEHEG
jgi:hypothetical protein